MATSTSRRSSRRKKKSPCNEALLTAITNGVDQDGFLVQYIDSSIGFGVFTTKRFEENAFLLEYRGDCIKVKEGRRREKLYATEDKGNFLFFFTFEGKGYCIDATEEEPFDLIAARMVNDSPTPNCKMKVVPFRGSPHLCLFSLRVIEPGEELRYSYGVDDRFLPWRLVQKSENKKASREPGGFPASSKVVAMQESTSMDEDAISTPPQFTPADRENSNVQAIEEPENCQTSNEDILVEVQESSNLGKDVISDPLQFRPADRENSNVQAVEEPGNCQTSNEDILVAVQESSNLDKGVISDPFQFTPADRENSNVQAIEEPENCRTSNENILVEVQESSNLGKDVISDPLQFTPADRENSNVQAIEEPENCQTSNEDILVAVQESSNLDKDVISDPLQFTPADRENSNVQAIEEPENCQTSNEDILVEVQESSNLGKDVISDPLQFTPADRENSNVQAIEEPENCQTSNEDILVEVQESSNLGKDVISDPLQFTPADRENSNVQAIEEPENCQTSNEDILVEVQESSNLGKDVISDPLQFTPADRENSNVQAIEEPENCQTSNEDILVEVQESSNLGKDVISDPLQFTPADRENSNVQAIEEPENCQTSNEDILVAVQESSNLGKDVISDPLQFTPADRENSNVQAIEEPFLDDQTGELFYVSEAGVISQVQTPIEVAVPDSDLDDNTSEVPCISRQIADLFVTKQKPVIQSHCSDIEDPDDISGVDNSPCTDILHPDIHIISIQKSKFRSSSSGQLIQKKNDRVFNKASACLYCYGLFTNISHHYITSHKNEICVAKILGLKELGKDYKKEVKREWELLRNEGNHLHNTNVVSSKQGQLLVVRRNHSNNFCSSDYTPCPLCKGWYLQSGLYQHVNYRCIAKAKENSRSASIMIRSLQHRNTEKLEKLDSEVIMTMRKDNITEVAKSDSIIRKVGEFYFSKHSRNQLRCKNFSSKHMRALATLLIKVREIDQSQNDLSFYLRPQKFDIIEQAAIAIAGGADGTCDNLEHPSTLKNIGYDIKHAVEIKEEVAITNHDLEKISEAKYFVKLYKRKWKLLSSSAIKQLEERTYNKKMVLPTCTELQVVINHMKTLLSEVARQGTVTSIKYRDVVELVQARLLLFNKRRPGELEALRVEDFEKRSNNDTVLSDVIQKTLTDLEKKLLDTHQVVTVRGKRGHAVPILIPPDCSDVMLMICDSNIRKDAGVKITNTYFFANTGDEVYRGVQSLQNVLRNCESSLDLTHVTASSLRKYLATNCQLLNLSDTELDWVVRHLGHSKLTHLSNYRLSSSTVERTKVAKLLVLLENGLLNEAQGNTLSDKELDDLILKKIGQTDRSVDSPDEEDEDDDCKQPIRTTATNKRQLTDTDTEVGDNTEQAVKRVRTKQKMKGDQDDDHGEESQSEQSSHTASEYSESSEESYEDDDDEDNTLPKKGLNLPVRRRNRPWPEEAVNALKREFIHLLRQKHYPSFVEIRRIKKKYPTWLANRTDAQIKSKLAHIRSMIEK